MAIGFIPIALDLLIVKLIRECKKHYPGVRLALHEMGTNDQLKGLRCGRIQVGFVQTYEQDLTGLKSRRLISEPYLLAVPENHELARRRRIPIKALEGINLILSPRQAQPRVYEAVLSSCRRAGFEPLLDYSVYGKHAALTLVVGVVSRPIDAGWPRMEIRLVWVADYSSSLKATVPLVRDQSFPKKPVASTASSDISQHSDENRVKSG